MRRHRRRTFALIAPLPLVLGLSCSNEPDPVAMELSFDFTSGGAQAFTADFADYPPADAPIYELASGYEPLPALMAGRGSALFIGGTNRSDDLFMYWKR